MLQDVRTRILVAIQAHKTAGVIDGYLNKLGYPSSSAKSVEDALKQFQFGNFQVVISDCPDQSHAANRLITKLKQIAPKTVILGYTTAPSSRTLLPNNQNPFIFEYISAPVSFDQLKSKLQRAVDKHGNLKHAAVRRGLSYAVVFSSLIWLSIATLFVLGYFLFF